MIATKKNSRQRAVRDEQKMERRQAILETIWQMFLHASYEDVTIAAVAKAWVLPKEQSYYSSKQKRNCSFQSRSNNW